VFARFFFAAFLAASFRPAFLPDCAGLKYFADAPMRIGE
jgi:hypothetical protein